MYNKGYVHGYGKYFIIRIRAYIFGGDRMVRLCWVNIQSRGLLLIWIRGGQGPTALVVEADGSCFDIFFSRLSFLFSLSLCLGDGSI